MTPRGLGPSCSRSCRPLDPFALHEQDWQVQSLVLLQRSLVVDLAEAAGLDPQVARDALPEI